MSLQINRDMIRAFILSQLPRKTMSLIADAILTDKRLARIHDEEKLKIDTKLFYDNKMTPAQRADFVRGLKKRMDDFNKINQPNETNSSSDELLLKGKLEEAYKNYEASQEYHDKETIDENPLINKEPLDKKPKIHFITMKPKYWLAAATIAALLFIGGAIGYNIQPTDSLENRLYAEYYAPLNYMDGYIPNNISFGIAKKYMEGEYADALLLLKDLPSSETIEAERNLFIGLSLMEVGKYREAAGYLEQVIASQSNFDYTPQARWYLGLCYLKEGSKEKAIKTFRAIVDSNDDYHKKAKGILSRLSD
ncbi:MAG: tetratricopeptide repeat protein [Bacteroidales bacterium]|nr:tetratricopeptide repeat protein [Bacteroidales bacterium]